MTRIVVIGAGIGGLTTAALLAKAGLEVTVLEAHIYPGGSAGTFFYKGYQFDAGATLAGGFGLGEPMERVRQRLDLPPWPVRPTDLAMQVHLPGGRIIDRWSDERRWEERERAFGLESLAFWRWQEGTADAMWALAAQNPAWPPAAAKDFVKLLGSGWRWLETVGISSLSPQLVLDAIRPVSAHLAGQTDDFKQFIDGQLLISAQAVSNKTIALYGAAALDLPRRGVVHVRGGMIGVARHLEQAIEKNGGEVLYRHRVNSVQRLTEGGYRIATEKGAEFTAEVVVANLPPQNLTEFFQGWQPNRLNQRLGLPEDGWGAFTTYLGVDSALLSKVRGLHHQIISAQPLAEGNSVFLSISPEWDQTRAPQGKRALTLSTHTQLESWWKLFQQDRPAYEKRKAEYLTKMMAAAETLIPGLAAGVELALPGTPVTFQRFTSRHKGWVGGFPQTNLLRAWPARLADNFYMVGDSIFPGQSTAAVALGGLRVGDQILGSIIPRSKRRTSIGSQKVSSTERI